LTSGPNPTDLLEQLYTAQLSATPGNDYLNLHRQARFLHGSVQVFRFYLPYLPPAGRILDWGCRHAPDACLIRGELGGQVELDGCDLVAPGTYQVFFDHARLRYAQLQEPIKLPYPDAAFDAVVASGVLEHVTMDYESLKELHRILKSRGRLIVTYLPNRFSVEEWWIRARRKKDFHVRTYGLARIRRLLLHSGFRPVAAGYQTVFDLLPGPRGYFRFLRPLVRLLQIHRLTSCLCVVAEKADYF
jgi:SAM-dependent methyltransferase